MVFFSFFKKKSSGLTGLMNLNVNSLALSVGLLESFINYFNNNVESILEPCNTDEAEIALKEYAQVVTCIRIINSICSEQSEQVLNDVSKVSVLSAACLIAQHSILLDYCKRTSENSYTLKLQDYISYELEGCSKFFKDIYNVLNDLDVYLSVKDKAIEFMNILSEKKVRDYIHGRVDEIIASRKL